MTRDELIAKIKEAIANENVGGDALLISATTVVAEMGTRIFENGRGSDGSPIGEYDDGEGKEHELWISDKHLPKNGSHKGKPHMVNGQMVQRTGLKTTYFANFQTVRKEMDREYAKVNLQFTGRLASNFLNSSLATGDQNENVVFDWKSQTIKFRESNNKLQVVLSDENFEKATGNEMRFGKTIFSPSDDEWTLFAETYKKELIHRLNSIK